MKLATNLAALKKIKIHFAKTLSLMSQFSLETMLQKINLKLTIKA